MTDLRTAARKLQAANAALLEALEALENAAIYASEEIHAYYGSTYADIAEELAEDAAMYRSSIAASLDTSLLATAAINLADDIMTEDVSCPCCGCEPGEGTTASCSDPNGCGFNE